MERTWILMLAIARVIQGLNAEIFKNGIKLVFHPVHGVLAHTDTGRHMVHEDMYGAVNLSGKVLHDKNRRNTLRRTLMLKHSQLKQKLVNSVSVFAK